MPLPEADEITRFAEWLMRPETPGYETLMMDSFEDIDAPEDEKLRVLRNHRPEAIGFMFTGFCRDEGVDSPLPIGDDPHDYEARMLVIVTPGKGRIMSGHKRDENQPANLIEGTQVPDGCLEAMDKICSYVVGS